MSLSLSYESFALQSEEISSLIPELFVRKKYFPLSKDTETDSDTFLSSSSPSLSSPPKTSPSPSPLSFVYLQSSPQSVNITYPLISDRKSLPLPLSQNPKNEDIDDIDHILSSMEIEEEEDRHSIPTSYSSLYSPSSSSLFCTYHVCYNPSYSVPVLYLELFSHDNLSHKVPIDDESAIRIVHKISQIPMSETDENAIGNDFSLPTPHPLPSSSQFVSVDFHPYLNTPMVSIHPCQTQQWMFNVQLPHHHTTPPSFSLLFWLSSMANFVGLKIPLNEKLKQKFQSQ